MEATAAASSAVAGRIAADTNAIEVNLSVLGRAAADADLAVRWRHATRAVLQHYIAEGLEVREFERGERSSTYVLARSGEGGEGQ